MTKRWSIEELKQDLERYHQELLRSGRSTTTIATYVSHPDRFIRYLAGEFDPLHYRR